MLRLLCINLAVEASTSNTLYPSVRARIRQALKMLAASRKADKAPELFVLTFCHRDLQAAIFQRPVT